MVCLLCGKQSTCVTHWKCNFVKTHPLCTFLPLVTRQWVRVTETKKVKCSSSFCLWSPILKTAIWNVYSVVYFSLKEKNNNNTGSCDNKRAQHLVLTNYMKRNILLADLTCVPFTLKGEKNRQQSVFTKSNGSAFGINSESRLSVTAPQLGRLLSNSVIL